MNSEAEYENYQDADMHQEEIQCTDPNCRKIFAHRPHTVTRQKAVRRDPA